MLPVEDGGRDAVQGWSRGLDPYKKRTRIALMEEKMNLSGYIFLKNLDSFGTICDYQRLLKRF